ncbi:MAG TPA: YihY/virulence factor BrkB family protein [Longimicrobiales bacterium]
MADIGGFLKQTAREAIGDNLTGEAAKVAYYFFLSLFPLILVLFALTGLLGGDAAFRWIMGRLETALPADTATYLERFVRQVTDQPRPGVLSIGILLTLWSASNVFTAFADGLNTMYDVEETRSWWKKRLVAIALLVATAVLIVGSATAILAGGAIGRALGVGALWNALVLPIAFVLLTLGLWLIYYFLPAVESRRRKGRILVGAIFGALVWIGATYLFRLYVANFGSYGETYGFVGAVIVLLLWLYLSALAVLLGGEVAAVLESRARPAGRAERRAAA